MLRVLTLNTHKGFSILNRRFILPELKEAISSVGADIVFLQEVIGENQFKSARYSNWPEGAHYEYLADTLWRDFAYGKNAVYPEGHHGNAILSKYPISFWEKVNISANRVEQRGILYCRIYNEFRDVMIHAICVHLGLLARWRRKQLHWLSHFITENLPPQEPLIVAGDFNDWQSSTHVRFGKELGLTEVFREIKGKDAKSYPSSFPILRLDRIYVRGLKVLDGHIHARGIWAKLSDHAALSADLIY